MKQKMLSAVVVLAMTAFSVAPAAAVDFEYFKGQSCADLSKEFDALTKSEKAVRDGMAKKDSKANTQAVVTTLLIGWPFWGDTDHGDANNMLSEIRADLRFVTRAQKANKCS